MKKIVFLLIFLICMIISTNTYAKYVIENEAVIAEIKIDPQPPTIEFIDVFNDNTKEYNHYAKKSNTIEAKIIVKEKNIKENHFGKDHIKIIVGEKIVEPEIYNIKKIGTSSKMVMYEIKLKGILGDGKLKIKVEEGTIKDKSEQINKETVLDTNIEIDNTSPVITSLQEPIEAGKIMMNLTSNELIRKVNGWELAENQKQLKKEFLNNVAYPFKVTDLAGNSTQVDINITKATNIKIRYGALNSKSNWSFGNGNNEIVGKENMLNNSIYKIEGISLYYDGNIEKDFIQLQSYMHTYWGPGIQGRCEAYETRYNYGYNPGENTYDTMKDSFLSNIDKKFSIYQGGAGVNRAGNRGIAGEPIPEEIAQKYLFGISGLRVKLKSYSDYSIVYQIWVKGQGWLKPVSNGEETYFERNKPISAYRMSLIPKTETQYLIDLWSKDIGTNNIK